MAKGELYLQLKVDWYLDERLIDLPDTAQLAYVKLLCLSKQLMSDGVLTDAQCKHVRASRGLPHLIEASLIERRDGGYFIPGFLARNKSRAEIQEELARRRSAAQKANHDRWHVTKSDPNCENCSAEIYPISEADRTPIVRVREESESEGIVG